MVAPVPLWVRVADGVSLFLAMLALWVIFTNRITAGIFQFVRYTSTPGVLYTLTAIVLVRHLLWWTPSWPQRIGTAWAALVAVPARAAALRAFIATRLLVFGAAVFAIATFGMAPAPGFQLSSEPLVDLPARFDAGWYAGIALDGYDRDGRVDVQRNIAFFPALPLLMRPVGFVFGAYERARPKQLRMVRTLWAGVVISLASFFFALLYLARIGADWLGEERGHSSVLLLAAYPFAFIFNAPYTEGLFLLCALAAVHHFNRGEWKWATLFGLATGLTRPNGFFLAVPLVLIVLQRMWAARSWRADLGALAVAAAPVAGMLAFTGYLYAITGVWFAWSRSHAAWGRSFDGVGPFDAAWRLVVDHGLVDVAFMRPYDTLNALAVVFALGMTWQVFRRIGAAWAVYVVLTIVPPLFAGGVLSMGRLTSTLFPVFLALAASLPPRAATNWAVAFAILQGLCAALFFTWRAMY